MIANKSMSLSERYDTFYKSSLVRETFADITLAGWPLNRVEAILAFAGKGESVLDVGCGSGHLLYQLRHRFTRLVGLEFSGHRLEQAKINLAGLPFVAIQGSAEAMTEIASDSIECVVSADTIEHVPDVYLAAAELFRVLRPGGRLIINTPNIAFVKKRALLLLGRFPSTSQPNEGFGSDVLFDGGHLHYFTFRSLSLLLQRAGFKIDKCVGYGKLGRLHHLYPPLLSGGVQLIARKPP
jgi:SAM-dependent methyltransferase